MYAYGIAMLIGIAATSSSNAQAPDLAANTFATEYSAEHSELGRRNLCIEAIDAGLIHSGMSVSDINKLFGTNFTFHIPPAFGAIERDAINFVPQIEVSQSPVAIQAPAVGWYFYFEFDRSERIRTYYVSNAHDK